MSWVHEAFDESDNVLDGYDFDECPPDKHLERMRIGLLRNTLIGK